MTLLNNRYLILNQLGKGGFGQTFLAEDTYLPSRRKCVIKQFKPLTNDPALLPRLQERFAREATVLERVGEAHSQIPKLYAYFVEDGQFYLVQELIEGRTLNQIVEAEGPFKSERVKSIISSLLEVLGYLHASHIIHRDIKPDNIIYRQRDSQPVLIDFGAVKETVTAVHGQGGTPSSVIIGAPGYMPMEQASGLAVYASDLHALGWTAIYLLTGKQPVELVDRRTGENQWRKFAPDVDYQLAVVIDRATQRVSSNRYETAEEMLEALQQTLPPTMPEPQPISPTPVPPGPLPPEPAPGPRALIDEMIRAAEKAMAVKDYKIAIEKYQTILKLSPNEPGMPERLKAAQEKHSISSKRKEGMGLLAVGIIGIVLVFLFKLDLTKSFGLFLMLASAGAIIKALFMISTGRNP